MLKKILVPLDGSSLSEASLPAAAALAQRFNSRITLLHVIERDAPSEVHHERHLTTAGEAQAYMADVAGAGVHKGSQGRDACSRCARLRRGTRHRGARRPRSTPT